MKDKIKSLFIFSVCCFSAAALLGEVICIENGDGSWTCSGFGEGNIIITNVVGTCTNCVGVAPEYCQSFKERIMGTCDYIHDYILYDIDASARQAISRVSNITNELSSFRQVTGNQSISYMKDNYPQSIYCRDPRGGTNVEGWSAGATYNQNYYAVCINSLYNYANTAMQPLQYVGDDLQNLTWDGALGDINEQLYQLNRLADGMDCTACKATFGDSDDDDDDKPQGGIAQEQLDALMRILNEKKAIAEDIRQRMIGLTNYIAHIDKNLYTIADESIYITNFVHRLDDYVFDDFTNRVMFINNDVSFLAQSLSNDLNNVFIGGFFHSFSNANVMADIAWDDSAFDGTEGEWEKLGKEIANNKRNEGDPDFLYYDGSSIDFAKYQRLNYFQRLEFLLGNLNGIFNEGTNSVNDTEADFTAEQKSKINEVENSFDSYEGIFTEPRDTLLGWIQQFQSKKDSINPFKNLFNDMTDSNLTFMPETQYTIDKNHKLKIPKIVLDWDYDKQGHSGIRSIMYVSNGLFTWIWVISGLVIFLKIIIKFFKWILAIIIWYQKLVASYYHTLYGAT